MPLATTSRVQVSYLKEVTFGTTPGTGSPQNLRTTGESLNYNVSKTASNEINSDRAVTSMIATTAEASGGVNIELSFDEYDDMLAALLQNPWVPFGVKGDSVAFSATIAPTTVTASAATTGASLFTLLQPGQWFTLSGTGSANDKKLFRVSKTVAPTSTVITLDAGTPGTAGGPYATTVLKAARVSNGSTQPSFTLQRTVADVGEYFSFRGMTVNSANLNVAAGAITTGDFNFMGKDSVQAATDLMPGAAVASTAYQIMSGSSGTSCALWIGGVPLVGTFVNSIKLAYDNALRAQKAICSLGSVGIGSGTINAKLDLEVYFASGAQFYSQLLDNTNLEVAFTAYDAQGNGYVFTFPVCNVSSYTVNAGGKDADLMAQISLTPMLDMNNAVPALRKVAFIDRLGVAMP